jgi:RHS repeat-associated protein
VARKDGLGNQTVFVYDAFGNLAAEYAAGGAPVDRTQYVTTDNLGSTRLITGANGTERHDYYPFGFEVLGGWRTTGLGYGAGNAVRQQFTGTEYDSESGLNFLQARYLSTPQGRFTSVDPGNAGASLGDPQSWNGYAYVGGNPLMHTDPTGEGIFGALFTFIGGLFGPAGAFIGSLAGNGLDVAVSGPDAGGMPAFYNPTNNFGLGNAGPMSGVTIGGGVWGSGSMGGGVFSFADQNGGIYDARITAPGPLPQGNVLDLAIGPLKQGTSDLISLMSLGKPTPAAQSLMYRLELNTNIQKNSNTLFTIYGLVTGVAGGIGTVWGSAGKTGRKVNAKAYEVAAESVDWLRRVSSGLNRYQIRRLQRRKQNG